MIGCAFGLGLGLDPKNRVTLVKPGGPTAATGKIEVGDRILTVDGADLMGREMQHVIRPADKHVLVVEKHEGEGSTQAARGRVLLAAAEAAARPLPPPPSVDIRVVTLHRRDDVLGLALTDKNIVTSVSEVLLYPDH